MSAKRALSDGPSTSRHSSSKSVKGEASLVRHSSLSRSLAVSKAQHNVNLTATPDRSLSTASTRRSVPPSSLDTAQQLVSVADKEANLSISTTSSLIDHGEAVDMKTASLAEDTPGDALSTSSLIDELRNHNIPTVDDTAYGIPKTVVLGGKSIDISDMEILEQIEMMRRAQDEAKKTASRLATDRLDSLSPIPALDIYQNMPSTDLSVIA